MIFLKSSPILAGKSGGAVLYRTASGFSSPVVRGVIRLGLATSTTNDSLNQRCLLTNLTTVEEDWRLKEKPTKSKQLSTPTMNFGQFQFKSPEVTLDLSESSHQH
mmetsp:Transcript_37176/g.73030  ORF Transcript_37176/g.73030 Transcript_37176/m.73030 type:complete len:105 (+) Transcript_37176:224-538(+)